MKLKLFIFLSLFTTFAVAQNSFNLTRSGSLFFPSKGNEVWGYVDGSGNEYALMGLRDAIVIIEVNDPANPVLVDSIPGPHSTWRDLKVFGNYGYVVHDILTAGIDTAEAGLVIMDLSGLPGPVTWKDTILDGMKSVHNLWIDENGFLYMMGGPGGVNTGFRIYDLNTDPLNPVLVGEWNDRYLHDAYVRGNKLYGAEIYAGMLEIFDVSDKANPVSLGSRTYPDAFTHNTWLNDAGDVCFSTDELPEAYIYSWDVSDPSNIEMLDKVRSSQSDGMATPHNVHVLDDYIIASYYEDGIVIFDAAKPNNLIEVGHYSAPDFNICWGAYPFLPSGIILGSDISGTFVVLAPTYQRGCYLEGIVTDSVTGLPISGAQITIDGTNITDFSLNAGAYATGTGTAGTYDVTYSKFGYYLKTFSVNLANGVTIVQDAELVPVTPVVLNVAVQESGSGNPVQGAVVLADSIGNQFDAVSGANGVATYNAFIPGTWKITAGKWGYITKEITETVASDTHSVTIELEKGYYDDFFFDFGWSVDPGTAVGGIWERVVPERELLGTKISPDNDADNDFGSMAFVTQNGGLTAGYTDVDGGTTSLETPSMDFSGLQDPALVFDRWFGNPFGGDTLRISVDVGSGFMEVANVVKDSQGWVTDTVRLSGMVPMASNVVVRFSAIDAAPDTWVEAGIDHFRVLENLPIAVLPSMSAQDIVLEIFPNPVENRSWVKYRLPDGSGKNSPQLRVLNLQGMVISTQKLHKSNGLVEVQTQLPKGLYFLEMRIDNERVVVKKFVR